MALGGSAGRDGDRSRAHAAPFGRRRSRRKRTSGGNDSEAPRAVFHAAYLPRLWKDRLGRLDREPGAAWWCCPIDILLGLSHRTRQSGRIEARTGLRMMPTFPRSPRSFRTAGFPQYGWKAGLSGGAFPDRQRLPFVLLRRGTQRDGPPATPITASGRPRPDELKRRYGTTTSSEAGHRGAVAGAGRDLVITHA